MGIPTAMLQTIPTILEKIVDHKRSELVRSVSKRVALERRAAARKDYRGFQAALTAQPPAILAEIKRASPSKGLLAPDYDPRRIARAYMDGGAACLSVLTDERFFQGSLDDLEAARQECSIPVLRKDFTLDPFHVLEAAARGADAILLIAAILTREELTKLREYAESFGMAALVEVHDEEELARSVDSGARILGVNNRDLHDFQVKLSTSLRLASKLPSGAVKVSESGILSSADMRKLAEAGYQAFLVGEHLMKSADPAAALWELRS